MVLKVAGLALLTRVAVQAEETLFQSHLQLLFIWMSGSFGRGCKLFFQNFNL